MHLKIFVKKFYSARKRTTVLYKMKISSSSKRCKGIKIPNLKKRSSCMIIFSFIFFILPDSNHSFINLFCGRLEAFCGTYANKTVIPMSHSSENSRVFKISAAQSDRHAVSTNISVFILEVSDTTASLEKSS